MVVGVRGALVVEDEMVPLGAGRESRFGWCSIVVVVDSETEQITCKSSEGGSGKEPDSSRNEVLSECSQVLSPSLHNIRPFVSIHVHSFANRAVRKTQLGEPPRSGALHDLDVSAGGELDDEARSDL